MKRALTHLLVAVSLVTGLLFGGSPAGAETDPDASEPVPAGVSGSVVRLYQAVFDRAPDPSGQAYWVDQYFYGLALPKVADHFMVSEEWTGTYGSVSNEEFVDLLYANVLDRSPDAEGRAYWAGLLGAGTTRSTLLLGFSESPEFVGATGTAPPEAPPVRFPAVPAHANTGMRIVYSNSMQRVWLIDASETVVDSYLVSGRVNVPRTGTYHVYSKSPLAWAGHDGITMTHMVRFVPPGQRRLSIGFHAIPHYSNGAPMQTEDQLGTHRSGGCVRQSDEKAIALYAWAPIGTEVVVLP